VAATYTIISERETRTLELLVALPVRVTQVLAAKLLVIAQMALLITGSLFVVDAVLLLALKLASVGYVLALATVLVGALSYSTAAALLISLLGKDYRTANNLNGALIVPTIFLTMAILMLVPGETLHTVVLGAVLFACALLATWIAMKVVTFERLLR
jgi:ABC-type Na+ efflux pump permease subunit